MKDVKSNTGLFPLENITTGKKHRIKLIYIYFPPSLNSPLTATTTQKLIGKNWMKTTTYCPRKGG